MAETKLKGLAASEGIAIGPVHRFEKQLLVARRHPVDDPEDEIRHLNIAIQDTEREMARLAKRVSQAASDKEAAIFEAQAMILQDPELIEPVQQTIRDERINAEFAWQQRSQYYIELLRQIGDEYISARANDVQDVSQMVLRELLSVSREGETIYKPSIVVAAELAPSDTVRMDKDMVLAFCTSLGGLTSHVAILSKALEIPAVVGLGQAIQDLQEGEIVVVDGVSGTLILDPSEATIAEYRQQARVLNLQRSQALSSASQPAITRDGVEVEVVANLGQVDEVRQALYHGAEGIGLLRTEFLFLDRHTPPDEEEQTHAYRAILDAMGSRPVVVRTLDIGGDKPAPYLNLAPEANPFLGVRGLRLSLRNPDLFETQLRALLRAGVDRNLKIMFPMLSTLDELLLAQDHLEKASASLETSGIPYTNQAEIGIMIEIPAAALQAAALARHVDFFSIGTNDLSQYTLAADRGNPEVSDMADPFQPAVLRLIAQVIQAAHAQRRWVGLCGELAGNRLASPLLLGLGLDEFSMAPSAIPLVKQTLRNWSTANARQVAERALELDSADAVKKYLEAL
jgi:phosphotransferase system enzyme I (PtsI)